MALIRAQEGIMQENEYTFVKIIKTLYEKDGLTYYKVEARDSAGEIVNLNLSNEEIAEITPKQKEGSKDKYDLYFYKDKAVLVDVSKGKYAITTLFYSEDEEKDLAERFCKLYIYINEPVWEVHRDFKEKAELIHSFEK